MGRTCTIRHSNEGSVGTGAEVKRKGRTARGNPRSWNSVIAGNTISLVNGFPEMVENNANVEKATAKGVKDHRKLDDALR